MSRFEHALVVGKFAPLHKGHELLLDTAGAEAKAVTVVVWSTPDFADMPNETRAGWVRARYPSYSVVVGHDGPPNDAPDGDHRAYMVRLLQREGIRPDVVFSAENYVPGFAAHLGVAHRSVNRVGLVGWSGTEIRADVHGHRHLLGSAVYGHFVERVVFLGAESTGKSTLARAMADSFGTAHVDEYGREHYEANGGQLDLEDYVTIAKVHRQREDEAIARAHRYLFVDTNAISTMFFSHYYNRDSLPELRRLAEECRTRYQHVIVCDDDIAFEQDGWRDNEVWRARMQGMVLHDLAVRGIEYSIVSGPLQDRVQQVARIVRGERTSASMSLGGHQSSGPRPSSRKDNV